MSIAWGTVAFDERRKIGAPEARIMTKVHAADAALACGLSEPRHRDTQDLSGGLRVEERLGTITGRVRRGVVGVRKSRENHHELTAERAHGLGGEGSCNRR